MLRTALRNVFAHKARLAMTTLAVMLGVAFVSGTLVFGDTVAQAFRDASSRNLQGVAVSVTAEYVPGDDRDEDEEGRRTALTSDLADEIRALPGVASVHPTVNGSATLADKDGNPLNVEYSWQNLATNYAADEADGQDSRFPITAGRGPAAEDEIALADRTADESGYRIGDTVRFATDGPALEKTLVGTVSTDDPRVNAGGSLVLFDTPTAQQLFLHDGQFDELLVSSTPGTDEETLTAEIRDLLPAEGAEATSGAQLAEDQARQITEATRAMTQMLLIFAGIALFVGVFIIANTFSMLIAQRSREVALMRAVGATRRQVVRSVLVEATLLGLVASVAGFAIGLGIATGMRPLLNAGGAGLPDGSLVVSTGALLWSLVVGVGVTVFAAWLPARKAAKIPPVEALSTVDQAPPARSMTIRNGLGGAVTGVGVLVMLNVHRLDSGDEGDFMIAMFGSVILLIGVIMLAPLLSRPLVSLAGWFTTRLFGANGKLATENALRNPRRTAATASALMIGLTLITGLSVAGTSTEKAIEKGAVEGLTADYKVSIREGLDTELGDRVENVPGVADTAALVTAPLDLNGEFATITGADPAQLRNVADVTYTSGSPDAVGPGRVAISEDLAERAGLSHGDTVDAELGGDSDAQEQRLTIVGVYQENRAIDGALGTLDQVMPHSSSDTYDSVYVKAESGQAAGLDLDIRQALDNSPLLQVQTREEITQEEAGGIADLLNMIYGLLGMSVLIAVLGVVNTLAMSVFERTREIGLLRAIGLDRTDIRQMVRLESVVICLFGAVLGIGLGTFIAWASGNLTKSSLATYETVLPWVSLRLFLLTALAIGVLAAIWPARRAARLNMLQSINAQ
ncbi:ABC transporter permease [Streptomyces sedi]|uniref:FtsX-like permease family protein n=1 Tax=Streptomyces sedi TaxID=555059 RepID=A0A5C4V8W0_9ACTN|nr:FtsX-like permease family protein [Streptomyces sedi]TNM32267.1 FtsX-like permease family protein [Streptomyces sedi]